MEQLKPLYIERKSRVDTVNGGSYRDIVTKQGHWIGTLRYDTDEQKAYGQLIEATVDMLKALQAAEFAIKFGMDKELAPYRDAWETLLRGLEQAIAKATQE